MRSFVFQCFSSSQTLLLKTSHLQKTPVKWRLKWYHTYVVTWAQRIKKYDCNQWFGVSWWRRAIIWWDSCSWTSLRTEAARSNNEDVAPPGRQLNREHSSWQHLSFLQPKLELRGTSELTTPTYKLQTSSCDDPSALAETSPSQMGGLVAQATKITFIVFQDASLWAGFMNLQLFISWTVYLPSATGWSS